MKRSANANPVIISVYVESPSPSPSQKPNHPTTKIKPDSLSKDPRIPRTDGYDRRAQLLAYARAMRTGGGSSAGSTADRAQEEIQSYAPKVIMRMEVRKRIIMMRSAHELRGGI
ncbi:hypothetical protein NL676_027693 [Syzygium grande]|nr:hypothetical protein NL676_027693 [Syzygium grande]